MGALILRCAALWSLGCSDSGSDSGTGLGLLCGDGRGGRGREASRFGLLLLAHFLTITNSSCAPLSKLSLLPLGTVAALACIVVLSLRIPNSVSILLLRPILSCRASKLRFFSFSILLTLSLRPKANLSMLVTRLFRLRLRD
jgi:hypothetical protein